MVSVGVQLIPVRHETLSWSRLSSKPLATGLKLLDEGPVLAHLPGPTSTAPVTERLMIAPIGSFGKSRSARRYVWISAEMSDHVPSSPSDPQPRYTRFWFV